MALTTEHVARKARKCDEYPPCRHGIQPGQLYRRHVAFPGDDGHEYGERPWVLEICAGCAADNYRPLTGARVEIYRLDRGDVEVVATGVITHTEYRGSAVEEYIVEDKAGAKHAVSPHRINPLQPVAL